jgi:TonB family protein
MTMKPLILFSLLFLLTSNLVLAQNTDDVFVIVEKMPEYPGGTQEMYKFISENIRYPQMEKEDGIQGQVVVSFIVEKNGELSSAKILRGVSPALDNEAIKVVNLMPAWNPGLQRGEPVRVMFNLPIRFSL